MKNQLIIATAMLFMIIAVCGPVNAAEGGTIKINPQNSNQDSFEPSISDDGTWITYSSYATNIVPGDTADTRADIFLYNCISGTTTKVTPAASNDHSYSAKISGDGNWITYESSATNIVLEDTDDESTDIFLYNRISGTTTKVTPLTTNGDSFRPSISDDGTWITYYSYANDIISGDTPDSVADIFLYNRISGTTTKVTPAASNGGSLNPVISGNGNWITYYSTATNIVSPDTDDTYDDIFLYNRVSGITTKVTPAASNWHSNIPTISDDGTWIAYESLATNIVSGVPDNGYYDIFLYNSISEITTKVTPLINNQCSSPGISDDGNWIVYESYANNIISGDTPDSVADIFLYNRISGTTTKVTPLTSNADSRFPSISGDGNWITYNSYANNIVAGDTNERMDIFLYNNPFIVPSTTTDPTNNPINNSSIKVQAANTIGMQKTGIPIAGLLLAILALLGGLVSSKGNKSL